MNLTHECSDKPHEECGVFGIACSPGDTFNTAAETYLALYALQHRGQESCGIAVSDGNKIATVKKSGLVPEVFDDATLKPLQGEIAIGHVRYASSTEINAINAQPITVTHINGNLSIALNGSIINREELRHEAEQRGAIFQSVSDAEILAYMLVRERLEQVAMEVALKNVMQKIRGAYSLVLLSGRQLIAARDPNGFRPLCIGRLGNSFVFSSETVGLDTISAEFLRDIEPGEIVVIEEGKLTSVHSGIQAKKSLCVFEYVYFARPDSIVDGLSVDLVRQEFGRLLAKKDSTEADIVVGVPDSGLAAALGYAQESGIPYAMGLVKNRYIGRTFIQPTQTQRVKAVRMKLNALSAAIRGKRIILVDDSIVRGTTCARIISLLREAGATEVHVRISSPPFEHACPYGTDIPKEEVLVSHNRTVAEMSEMIGASSLQFLDQDDLRTAMRGLTGGYCDSCFFGNYPLTNEPHEPHRP